MNPNNVFFDKILANENLKRLLKDVSVSNWKAIDEIEREELISNIFDELIKIYPGTRKCSLQYICGAVDGEECGYVLSLNENLLEEDNPYVILNVLMHEFRHKLQDIAIDMYNQKGKVFKTFELESLKAMSINRQSSVFGRSSNYIRADQFNYYEYSLQPLEQDANRFAYDFLSFIGKEINTSKNDAFAIKKAKIDFEDNEGFLNYYNKDIIVFNKIYKFNYEDYVANNYITIKKDRQKADEILSLMDNMDELKEDDLYVLFSPWLWQNFNNEQRISLIKRLLKGYDIECTIKEDTCVYVDNNFVHVNNSFILLEELFEIMGLKQIMKLYDKPVEELSDEEKLILFNLKEENKLSKKDNPFLFEIQPYMLYIHKYILDMSKKFFDASDKFFEKENNYLDKYKNMCLSHDVNLLTQKVKMLTGDGPSVAYKKALKKSKNIR